MARAPTEGDDAATHYRQLAGGAVKKMLPAVFTRCARCKRENDAGQGLWEFARRRFVASVSDTKGR